VTGNAEVGGTLTVSRINGYSPVGGDRFRILTAASRSGTFPTTNLPPLGGGASWQIFYTHTYGELRIISASDADGDGLADAWEILHFGSTSVSVGGSANFDGDPLTDYEEYVADTDPKNPASYFRLTAISNSPVTRVYFLSSSNRIYSLKANMSLQTGNWEGVTGQTNLQGTGWIRFLEDAGSESTRFYRVGVSLP